MAHLHFKDLPPAMKAQVARQLGISYEEANGVVTTYHLCLSIAGKFSSIKSTDALELSKVLDVWRQKYPLNPYRVYITERLSL